MKPQRPLLTKLKFIEPMYARLVNELAEGKEWLYEVKVDGYRCLAGRDSSGVTLWSRRGNLFTTQFPQIAQACEQLPPGTLVDGEIVALDESGRVSFNLLQHHRSKAQALLFYVFDVLIYRGRSLLNEPLSARRETLSEIFKGKTAAPIALSESLEASPVELVRVAKEFGFEGIVAKRKDSVYESGKRTGAWVKYKVNRGQEFVIGGYTPGNPFGCADCRALRGRALLYAAKVRNGFVPQLRRDVATKFKRLQIDTCPFANLPERKRTQWALTKEEMKNCVWLKPELVSQIEFTEWTPDGHLRHSKFVGMREDKAAREVVREGLSRMLLGLLQELDFCQALKLNPAIRQEHLYFIKSRKIGGQPMTTFTRTREQWERKESADWWNAGQAARQQIIGAATEKMLDLAGVQAGSRVLDVAAGTGESTLMAAQRVGGRGYVLATDHSSSMLSVAAEVARKESRTNVETRVMNAENLELDVDSFDAVICRQALMLFPNPAKGLTEMRRVVKPEGKVAVIVFSALEKNPYQGIVFAIVQRLGNIPPPSPGEPWMFALGDPGALEDLYRRTGFLNVSVHTIPIQRRFPSTADAIRRMRNGAGDMKELMNRLNETERERAWVEIEEQLRRFEGPNGLEVPGEVLIGVGTK